MNPYQVGYNHGRTGVRALAHRRGVGYATKEATRLYMSGYKEGARARYEEEGKVKLDYDNPLNNQLFLEDCP